MKRPDIVRYIVVFIITVALFVSATALSSFLNNRKLADIKEIQDTIAIDIASNETQFQLLQELSCNDLAADSLTDTLNETAEKITYSENNINGKDQLVQLKRYYSILQIKDYLLMQKIKARCGTDIIPVFYFYTTAENCSECVRQSLVLTKMREEYPILRVYSFDYNLELSALQALIKVFNVEDTKLPALVVNDKLYTGFKTQEEIEKLLPSLLKIKEANQKKIEKEEKGNIE